MERVSVLSFHLAGKMELFSRKFIEASAALFEWGADDIQVVCTIPSKSSHAFVKSLRERGDKKLIEVSRDNRDSIPKSVIDLLRRDSK